MALSRIPRIVCLLLVGIVSVSNGQKVRPGKCPALSSFANPTFTLSKLVGVWREIARSRSVHRKDWNCVTYTFTEVIANSQYSVAINGVQKHSIIPDGFGRVSGLVTVTGNNGVDTTAGTFFTFDLTQTQAGKTSKLDYYIVRTDNKNYIALYACTNFLFGRIDSAIILAKDVALEAEITAALNSVSKYGVSRSDLVYPFTPACIGN